MSGSYRDLQVWQKAMELVFCIYEITQDFPKHELYGLTRQLRRAAVSVPSNIAEGKGRSSDKDWCVFLYHARGSLHELETQLLIASHLGYLQSAEAQRINHQVAEIARMLNGLISFAASA